MRSLIVDQTPPSNQTGPGDTVFTRTPLGASECPRALAYWITAAFTAPYELGPAGGAVSSALVVPMATTAPDADSPRAGWAASTRVTSGMRSRSKLACHCSGPFPTDADV